MAQPTVDEVADSMYELVKETQGKKDLKPMDLIKAMREKYGDECDKALCKQAIRQLMDSGRCVYSYVGGSYVKLPPDQQ
jgi:hypothetical protein